MVKSGITGLKKVILGIAIALVLVFFLGYAVDTFYKEPRHDEMCGNISRTIFVDSCEDYDGSKIKKPAPVRVDGYCNCFDVDENGTRRCEANNPEYDECYERYSEAREMHGRISFIILIVLGLASIIIGGLVLKVEAVGNGIMGGGVITIIYAAIRYWGSIEDYARLSILGIALVVLVWIGYKKLKD